MKIYAAIRVCDVETLGLSADSGVCEIGWTDVYANSIREESGEPYNWEVATHSESILINPGKPIPPEARAEHHISDKDVADAPDFEAAVAAMLSVHSMPASCERIDAWAAHNAKFDRQFLDPALGNVSWICTMRCAQHVYPDAPSFKNQVLRYHLNPRGLNPKKAMPPHRAAPDSYVTAFLLRELLNRGNTIDRLVKATQRPPILLTCRIGKWNGKPYSEVDSGFLRWMLDKDFDEADLATARHHLEQRGA